jgi:transposase, IS30 family
MAKRRRRMFSAAESAEVWDRWQRGEGLKLIGRVFGRTSSAIFQHLKPHGGIRPVPRRRSRRMLGLDEREEISRGIAAGVSLRSVARGLGRAPSTISRELLRNGGPRRYRATAADKRAWDRALRPKLCKLARHDELRQLVAARLQDNWSPEQIAGWLKHTYPDDEAYQVSHETIYRSLFVQARGVLKKDLQAHLRSGRAIRRSRHASSKGDQRGSLVDAVSIRERPASVEDRAIPGHWEGDLLCGSANSYVVTLVERHSRYVMLGKVPNRDSQSVTTALIALAQRLPDELLKSLTWDRGKEMARHKSFTLATDAAVYFCDPQSPWQRGSNENTNGLLRQYFPKGTNLAVHSQERLDEIARQLNGRPRKTLGFETPAERFEACVAMTG